MSRGGNLQRGTSRKGQRLPVDGPPIAEQAAMARERDEATRRAVEQDPDADLAAVHGQLVVLTTKVIRRANREAGPPERAVMDTIRELRATTEAVNEARKGGQAAASAREFLEEMDSRVARAAERVGASAGPRPVAEPPS